MITVPIEVVEFTKHELFQKVRARIARYGITQSQDVVVSAEDLSGTLLEELFVAAKDAEDLAFEKDVEQIIAARRGEFKTIRSINAMSEVLLAYLGAGLTGTWIYHDTGYGFHQPYSVDDFVLDYNRNYQISGTTPRQILNKDSERFHVTAVVDVPNLSFARRRPETLLANAGLYKETPELRASYTAAVARMVEVLHVGNRVDVSEQIFEQNNYGLAHLNLKRTLQCVADTDSTDVLPDGVLGEAEYLPLLSLTVPVFDLWNGKMVIVYIGNVQQHSWRDDAVERLVLPEAQKRVLELAVGSDADGFGGDFVDDKTPGNILLCKGEPGIGKTLTAEAYAETTHSALYPVDMNILASRGDVGSALRTILSRARRWNAFILLDEADVIVSRRGSDVHKNAIVAEVLKAVERYEKPIFMTTNRPDDIDEAVISRCLMILHYEVPKDDASIAVWEALSDSYKVELPEGTVERFVKEVGSIPPREIGQIIRLSARMAARDSTTVSFEHLVESAAMRGINLHDSGKEASNG